MQSMQPETFRNLVIEAIARSVNDAARGSGFLRAGELAYAISKAHPDCSMSGTELVNEVIHAAASAGVAVEMSQPYRVSAHAA
jgi:hypothetical protein